MVELPPSIHLLNRFLFSCTGRTFSSNVLCVFDFCSLLSVAKGLVLPRYIIYSRLRYRFLVDLLPCVISGTVNIAPSSSSIFNDLHDVCFIGLRKGRFDTFTYLFNILFHFFWHIRLLYTLDNAVRHQCSYLSHTPLTIVVFSLSFPYVRSCIEIEFYPS